MRADGFDRRPGWRSGGSDAAEPDDLGVVQRVRSDAEKVAAVEVEHHQRVGFDPDTDPAAGQDLRRQQHGAADRNGAAPGHGPLDLDRLTVFDGQGRRSSVDRAGSGQHGRSAVVRWERTDLIRTPPIIRWITSTLAQNRTVWPDRIGPSQNCRPATAMFPEAGTIRSNSTGPPAQGEPAGDPSADESAPSSRLSETGSADTAGAAVNVGGSRPATLPAEPAVLR